MNANLIMEVKELETKIDDLQLEMEAKKSALLFDITEFVDQGRILSKKIKMLNIEINPYSKDALDYIVSRNEENVEDESNLGGLSETDKSRKYKNYSSKLKACIKLYTKLNDKLEDEIKQESNLDPTSYESTFAVPLPSEIKLLEKKLNRYESEMSKFNKRYPWLRDSKYNLLNISDNAEKLVELRNKKSELMDKLSYYGGLSPNITEAKLQLSKLRSEFTQTNNYYLK